MHKHKPFLLRRPISLRFFYYFVYKLIIPNCFFCWAWQRPGRHCVRERTRSNEVLSLALDLHIQKIQVATDCKPVVNHLKEYKGPSAMIISDIKNLLSRFEAATVQFESRESNREAHNLATACLSLAVGRHLWLLQPPDFTCMPTYVMVERNISNELALAGSSLCQTFRLV